MSFELLRKPKDLASAVKGGGVGEKYEMIIRNTFILRVYHIHSRLDY